MAYYANDAVDYNKNGTSSSSANGNVADDKGIVVDTNNYADDKSYTSPVPGGAAIAGEKSYDPSISPDVDILMGHHLKKTLRWWDLIGVGIGCIIGAGIFVTTGTVFTTLTGPAIILSYGVAGTCCFFASLCYSEFAAMAPNSGSAYAFTSQTLGEFWAWMVGWNLVLEYTVSAATVTQAFSSYFQTFIGLCGGNLYPRDFASNPNASGEGNDWNWISYPRDFASQMTRHIK